MNARYGHKALDSDSSAATTQQQTPLESENLNVFPVTLFNAFRSIVFEMLMLLSLPFGVVAVVSGFVMLISVPAGIVFGLWDLLVWATNAEWKTSNFMISIASAIAFVAAWICIKISTPIMEFFRQIGEKIEPN